MNELLINIDVPDLAAAEKFYCSAFGLKTHRKFKEGAVELAGLPCPIFLLEKKEGSLPFQGAKAGRSFGRHWSPIHIDVVVSEIEPAIEKARAAGAKLESEVRTAAWGKLALFSDPFGNGFCLIQFLGRGYDEIAEL